MTAYPAPTPDQAADVMATVVALLRADLSGDLDGAEAMMDYRDPWPVLGAMTGVARAWGVQACGSEEAFARELVELAGRPPIV